MKFYFSKHLAVPLIVSIATVSLAQDLESSRNPADETYVQIKTKLPKTDSSKIKDSKIPEYKKFLNRKSRPEKDFRTRFDVIAKGEVGKKMVLHVTFLMKPTIPAITVKWLGYPLAKFSYCEMKCDYLGKASISNCEDLGNGKYYSLLGIHGVYLVSSDDIKSKLVYFHPSQFNDFGWLDSQSFIMDTDEQVIELKDLIKNEILPLFKEAKQICENCMVP